MLLSCEGFNVIDLGVDVPSQVFVEALEEHRPRILGLSCLLTSVFDNMRDTILAIDRKGLRPGVSVIVGGVVVNETVCRYTGADYWTSDAMRGVQWCRRLITRD